MPIALALLPVLASTRLAGLAEAELFHAALLVPVVLISATALGRRALAVRWLGPLLLAALGAMTGALFVTADWQEQALTAGGASLLILAHWINLRARARD